MVSVVFALERSHHYVYGYTATVKTDHKPLVSVRKKCIVCNSPSLQRLLPRLFQNDVNMEYQKGKGNVVADALFKVSQRSTTKKGENEEDVYRGTPRRELENSDVQLLKTLLPAYLCKLKRMNGLKQRKIATYLW